MPHALAHRLPCLPVHPLPGEQAKKNVESAKVFEAHEQLSKLQREAQEG